MTAKRITQTAVLGLFGALLLNGCYTGLESQPYIAIESQWEVKGPRVIAGPNIEIIIKLSNYETPFHRKSATRVFGISLWFDPKQDGFAFNPMDTRLIFSDTGAMRPGGVNMELAGSNLRAVEWECGNYPKRDFGPGPSYALVRGTCFDLYFDVKSPSPETDFSLSVDGLSRDGKPIRIPEIHFRKGSFRVFDFLGK